MTSPETQLSLPSRPWVTRFASWLVFAVPFAVAVCLLGPSPGWLDAPELVAASQSLGLSHPPGHPFFLLSSHLATLLPFGSVAFRVALFSALCYGLMAWLAFRGALQCCALLFGEAALTWRTRGFVLLGVWLGCFQFSTMAQAVRPEVYTLHALLAFTAIERLLGAWRLARMGPLAEEAMPWGVPHSVERGLLQAALCCGLGLANHHYLMFLLLPGALVVVFALWRAKSIKAATLGWAFGVVCLGLSTYGYLPARSLQAPPVHWGVAHTPSMLTWQVTARLWQRSVQTTKVQSLGYRAMLLLTIYIEQWGLWLLLALLGMYIVCRLSLLCGGVLLLWIGGQFVGRLLMVVDRYDLDLHGYLAVSMVLLGWTLAFAAVWLANTLVQRLTPHEAEEQGEKAPFGWRAFVLPASLGGLWLLLLLPFPLALHKLPEPKRYPFSLAHCDHSDQKGPLLWSRLMEEPLPYGTILVTNYYQYGFLRWYRKVIERHRPDIVLLQRNLLQHPNIAALERQRNPLAKQVDFSSKDKQKPWDALRSMTNKRTICFESGHYIPPKVARALFPIGMFFCWVPERALPKGAKKRTKDDDAIREQQQHFWREVYSMMELRRPLSRLSREQKNMLLWTHLQHAKFYQQTKRWRAGLQEVRLAMRLSPKADTLHKLLQFFKQKLHRPRKTF